MVVSIIISSFVRIRSRLGIYQWVEVLPILTFRIPYNDFSYQYCSQYEQQEQYQCHITILSSSHNGPSHDAVWWRSRSGSDAWIETLSVQLQTTFLSLNLMGDHFNSIWKHQSSTNSFQTMFFDKISEYVRLAKELSANDPDWPQMIRSFLNVDIHMCTCIF